jgi:hypothetical protein
MNEHSEHRIRRIRSRRDLEKEKARLQVEILKTEGSIKSSFRHLVDALTFRNIIKNISEDIAVTSSIFSKAYETGKKLFSRKKKKKKAEPGEPAPTQSDSQAAPDAVRPDTTEETQP